MDKERNKFSYRLFYSSYIPLPTSKSHDSSWNQSDKIIKIFDEKSDSKYFEKKTLYFSLFSSFRATIRVTAKFYEVDEVKLEIFKKKKKLDVFDVFQKQHKISKNELQRIFDQKS